MVTPLAFGLFLEALPDTLGQGRGARLSDLLDGGLDLTVEIGLTQDALGKGGANLLLDPLGQIGFEHVRWRDQLADAATLGHLAVEPRDELWRRHRVEFDAVGLQPVLPTLAIGRRAVFAGFIHRLHIFGDRLDKWQAKVAAAVRPAATEAEAALHAEVRRHAVGLKGQERLAFLERHGSDPRVAASLLEAPAFLTGMTEAERSLIRSKIEQAVLDPEIVQAKKDVTRALADSEHGWDRAQVLIAEDAGLRKSADGTWSAPVDADANAA